MLLIKVHSKQLIQWGLRTTYEFLTVQFLTAILFVHETIKPRINFIAIDNFW